MPTKKKTDYSAQKKKLLGVVNKTASEYDDLTKVHELAGEVRTYLNVGALVPPVIAWKKAGTVRKAQQAYSKMESHLDRIITIQHDAKVVTQLMEATEYRLLGFLAESGELSAKSTKPQQQQALMMVAPVLIRVKTLWSGLDDLCTQARQRISSAQDSMKQMIKLDDNLRWATERNPG